MKNKSWGKWTFRALLTIGYLADGLVVALFFYIGSASGWSFSGDSAGGIGLLYAATIFLPHLFLFFFALVTITIQSIINWKKLNIFVKSLVLFYYLVTILILWINYSENGGYALRYYTRKIMAPSYYPSIESIMKKYKSSPIFPLIRRQKEAVEHYYTKWSSSNPSFDSYLMTNFAKQCYEDHFKNLGNDEYQAYIQASSITSQVLRSNVHSLQDAIFEENFGDLSYTKYRHVDGFLEQLLQRYPGLCKIDADMEQLHQIIFRGRINFDVARKDWDFDWNIDSRDILPLSESILMVADGQRGIELWTKKEKKWEYNRTLDGRYQAFRILKRGNIIFAVVKAPSQGPHIVRYIYDPDIRSLTENSRQKIISVREIRDWDSDQKGERLYFARGYGGVMVIDFRDPLRPVKKRANGQERDNFTYDIFLGTNNSKLYAVTNRRGLIFCDIADDKVSCDSYFKDYIYSSPDMKQRCRLRDGALHCEDPVPPNNLRGIIPLTNHRLLCIGPLQDSNTTRLALFDERPSNIPRKPSYIGTKRIDFPLPRYIRNHLEDTVKKGNSIYLANRDSLAIIDADDFSLLGCFPMGYFHHFIVTGEGQIIAAAGKRGIIEIPSDGSRLEACDKMKKPKANASKDH